jgi:hypothetical protein
MSARLETTTSLSMVASFSTGELSLSIAVVHGGHHAHREGIPKGCWIMRLASSPKREVSFSLHASFPHFQCPEVS